MGAAASVAEMTETVPESKEDLRKFLGNFSSFAVPGEEGRLLRKSEWPFVDPNGSRKVSLTECHAWIRQKLTSGRQGGGERLFQLYQPSFILAFHDAADAQGTGDNHYVTWREFRLLVAYVCFYAAMFDWFAAIDGSKEGVDKSDDKRLSLEEWEAWFAAGNGEGGMDAYSFAVAERLKNKTMSAKEFFEEIDTDGKGMILLKEWCRYIKKYEIKARTQVGKWLDAGDVSVTRNLLVRAASMNIPKDTVENSNNDLKLFVGIFAPIAEIGTEGKNTRKKEWLTLDGNGSRNVSLAECWRWVKIKLINELKDKDEAIRLWKMFRPSYILAFNDAANGEVGGDDSFISAREFRHLVANICFYAAMFDWFTAIDGGSVGTTKDDDRRISLGEWETWFVDKDGVDEGRFAVAKLMKNEIMDAKEFFKEMDADHGGMVLLKEWCQYIKKFEISGDTDVGKWLDSSGLLQDDSPSHSPVKAKT